MYFGSRNNKRNEKNEEYDYNKEEDYYRILEVDVDASFEEIKKAYRRLSMMHHPDKNGNSEESTIKFKQLATAYETLSDENKRRMYDLGIRNGNMGMGSGGMSFDMNINPFDIFNMIFGNHMNPQQQQQQQQQQQHQQQQQGISSFINFANGMPMPMSMGMGMPMPMGMSMGIPMPMGMGIHIIHPEQMDYTHAHIHGFRDIQQQQQQQHVFEKNDIHITLEDAYNGIEKYIFKMGEQEGCICIPPGVNDKEVIISTKPNGQIVHVTVNINPHDLFQRNGLDLILEKEISLKESLCGLEFSIKHINGKTFHLQHKDGTIIKDGVSKTIQRLGMKNASGAVGNFTITFKITYPDKLSKEQIEKLYEIL